MATDTENFGKALRRQRALKLRPLTDSDEYYITDSDGYVVTQHHFPPIAERVAKFISNQGILTKVEHKGQIMATYLNGSLHSTN